MKGFGIEVKNNLIEWKHIEAMGIAVWLYMWFLDKMTSITEEGIGNVLGGKPIVFEKDVQPEMSGLSHRTYKRWLAVLKKAGYVNVTRTPRGLVITVNKAFKRFGRKSDGTKMSQRWDKSGTSSTYRHNKDNNDNVFPTGNPSSSQDMDYEVDSNIDEDGNVIKKGGARKKAEPKNKIALRIQHHFIELCRKNLGTTPVMDKKGYMMVLFAMNKGGLSEKQIYDLFEEWIYSDKPVVEVAQITRALSGNQITAFKARNGI